MCSTIFFPSRFSWMLTVINPRELATAPLQDLTRTCITPGSLSTADTDKPAMPTNSHLLSPSYTLASSRGPTRYDRHSLGFATWWKEVVAKVPLISALPESVPYCPFDAFLQVVGDTEASSRFRGRSYRHRTCLLGQVGERTCRWSLLFLVNERR